MIIHGPRAERDFTVLPNRILRDDELSYRARGLLCFLLSQPPDWEISSNRLTLEFGEGRDAVRSAIRELINTGYMQLQKVQGDAGRWSTHYIVTADPWWFENPVDNPPQPVDNSGTGA
jgi:hypothetical protein